MNKKLAIIAAFAVVGVFAAVVVFRSEIEETLMPSTRFRPTASPQLLDLTNVFTQWKQTHGKTYSGAEHQKRYTIFQSNYKTYQQINADKRNTFKVGLNRFSDLTRAEFAALHLGLKRRAVPHRVEVEEEETVEIQDFTVKGNAVTVDWRQKGAVTPVKNQGNCGSCWAFSTTGALEGYHFVKTGKLLNFSEQQLVDCSGSYGNQGCNGGLMESAMKYTAQYGLEQETAYPYTGKDGKCKYDKSKATTLNKGYKAANGDSGLEAALKNGPVSVSIEADQAVFQGYTGGVLNSQSCGTNLDHGVLAVGYGTENGQGYWIVKNSWGTSWGEKGYVRIARASGKGICGINQDNCQPN